MKDFLACTELVTLVHHVKTADSDSYVCYPIQGVSWYAKTETAVTADGAKAVNVYKAAESPRLFFRLACLKNLTTWSRGKFQGYSSRQTSKARLISKSPRSPTTGAGLFRMWR